MCEGIVDWVWSVQECDDMAEEELQQQAGLRMETRSARIAWRLALESF